MQGLALAMILFTPAAGGIELDADVVDIDVAAFELPILVDPARKKDIRVIRIFVSTDRGLTWTRLRVCTTADTAVRYDAPRDGHYWFAVQAESWNGAKEPLRIDQLRAVQKVYVNAARKNISRKGS